MLTTKIRITVLVLAAVFGVAFATLSVASVVGPVAPAHAADDEADEPLDEDDCEWLEHLYNGAVKEASDARAAGYYERWSHVQDIAAELYLEAQFGGCEWAAEAAPPTSTGSTPAQATQDAIGYDQSLQSNDYRTVSKSLGVGLAAHFTDRGWAPAE